MFFVPAMARDLARLQLAHLVPRGQGIALFGGPVGMVAHAIGPVLAQSIAMIEQHQGMRRLRVGIGVIVGTEKPGDAITF